MDLRPPSSPVSTAPAPPSSVASSGGRRRILFVAEAVTLAQVVRLVTLARSLDPAKYEVHFASARFDPLVFEGTTFRRWPIDSLPPEEVEARVREGQVIYTNEVLARYLAQDRALLADVRPDLVVGDLRLSLTVAAPLAGVPLASLINAYWSPTRIRRQWPLPDHPLVAKHGPRIAGIFFPLARPAAFRAFAAPVNRLRRRHGLSSIGSLGEVLCHGTYTLFPDVPELAPMKPEKGRGRGRGQAPERIFLGPVLWSPALPWPAAWPAMLSRRPTLYVTLGSSGRVDCLPAVLEAVGQLEVDVWLSTAGRPVPATLPSNVRAAPYLPGDRAAAQASLVISNGGSTTSYQALAAGCPVLGLPSNLDQWLAMESIEEQGAGKALRASTVSAPELVSTIREMLGTSRYREAAQRVAELFAAAPSGPRFASFVARALAEAAAAKDAAPAKSVGAPT